ncbi:periplasmic divalent cation tolerance protein [Acidovorax soli]|jgi:periplasmic divalent cation tolerance protein|uniref:Periplasmic divalent cation tolerance protein n=1 Tax=Acidovorax soli TaxID=592050 RepID=A0A7X0PBY9_9BURK|nr:divalent-cation tolerance protein CutA [Acidovorax soli]MBB6559103.1 periplasmic divalent cation tolerance protein [Acidovorax soli]
MLMMTDPSTTAAAANNAAAPHQILMVTTTVATEAEAKRLAHSVLHARLAACVQVEPITAYFHWEGALEECRELRVACKTAASAMPALMALLRKQHPYTLPQLVVQPVQASAEYGCWVDEQLAPAPQRQEAAMAMA